MSETYMSDLSKRHAALIRALLYPMIFKERPSEEINHAIDKVIRVHALGAEDAEYLDAIKSALASPLQLAKLLPQPHSESVVRDFLARLLVELEGRTEHLEEGFV